MSRKIIERKEFIKALFPLDLSEHSLKALDFLPYLKKIGIKEIGLKHVIDESILDHVIAGFDPVKLTENLRKQAKEKLKEVSKEAEKWVEKTVIEEIEVGHPADIISKTAREKQYDIIVMTDKGKGYFKLKLLGGTTEEVINFCSKPVLVIKAERVKDEIKEVVAALSARDFDWTILSYTYSIARNLGVPVKLVHAIRKNEEVKGELFQEYDKTLENLGLKSEYVFIEGPSYKSIPSKFNEKNIIVVGKDECTKDTKSKREDGTTIENIVRRAYTHVLVVF